MEARLTAETYLRRDLPLHVDMLEALRRGTAELRCALPDGVLLWEPESELWLLSAASPEASDRLLAEAGELSFACVHQRFTVSRLAERYDFSFQLECWQTAWLHPEPIPAPGLFELRILTPDAAPWVNAHYHGAADELPYVRTLLERGLLTGAFEGDVCLGFIGRHSDGSVGLLSVLPEYRRRGVAEALAIDAADRELAAGRVPYGQVVCGNEPSIALHRKLGLTFSDTPVWWLELTPKA